MDSFGTRLRSLRLAAGLTQEKLAHACGYSGQSRIANYERGIREPSLADIQTICRVLGVSPSDLVDLEVFERLAGQQSHPARLDPDVLRIAAQTARAIAARAIDPEQDADLLAKAYDAIVELAGSQPPPAVIVDLLDWYRGRGGASGLSGEGATGGAGPAAGGKPARKASA